MKLALYLLLLPARTVAGSGWGYCRCFSHLLISYTFPKKGIVLCVDTECCCICIVQVTWYTFLLRGSTVAWPVCRDICLCLYCSNTHIFPICELDKQDSKDQYGVPVPPHLPMHIWKYAANFTFRASEKCVKISSTHSSTKNFWCFLGVLVPGVGILYLWSLLCILV